MFHDNRTKVDKSEFRVPLTGFTHTYTPNDFKINDDDVMEQLGEILNILRFYDFFT